MRKFLLLIIIISFFIFFHIKVYAADTVAPVSTISADPFAPNGENNWYTTYPALSINATDNDSGVETIYYKINDDPWIANPYSNSINLIRNSSFETGYIDSWDYRGSFASVGYKSSLLKYTGNYSGGIVTINFADRSYWESEKYISALPLTTYYYSFYIASITSFLDNGFYEIVSVATNGSETILASDYNIDLKLNYKNISGSFLTSSLKNRSIVIRIGLYGIGHLSIDDVYLSKSPPQDTVEFLLDREGVNTISFYSKDSAGNKENTKVATIKVDTQGPFFSNFRTTSQENVHTFASLIDVQDTTSGLYATDTPFNYSVDGINSGYFENYATCSGDFNYDLYLNIDNNFSNGARSGTLTTPVIDYCDSNFLICKELKFYVKDLAGNISLRDICVNGPYISTQNGDIFARESILQMGQGAESNLSGLPVSSGPIIDIVSSIGAKIDFYSQQGYLNNLYLYYYQRLNNLLTDTSSISNDSGIFYIQGSYSIDSPISYIDKKQVVFVDGNLNINGNITSTSSNVFYFVNGVVTINKAVTNLDAVIAATNQIYTSDSFDLAQKIGINGSLYAPQINFTRNTDKTLGASELIYFPLSYFFSVSPIHYPVIYRREIMD